MSIIIDKYKAQQVMEGAGVLVNRVFGHGQTKEFDPFLMLDYFNNHEDKESPGFPWHPHKGIETITYILRGNAKHEDSMGNSGVISDGELQWMSAGKGIYHQEMLESSPQGVEGFQFWVNLPANKKLKEPGYLYIKKGEMKSSFQQGAEVRVISGDYDGITGPIDKSDLGISMLHVIVDRGEKITLTRDENKQGFLFLFEGNAELNGKNISSVTAYTLGSGELTVQAGPEKTVQFIFVQGKPLREPIAWYGPVVMNTEEELQSTFSDLQMGTFVPGMKY